MKEMIDFPPTGMTQQMVVQFLKKNFPPCSVIRQEVLKTFESELKEHRESPEAINNLASSFSQCPPQL